MEWKWNTSGDYLTCKEASQELWYAAISRAKILQFARVILPNEKIITILGNRKRTELIKIKVKELGRSVGLPRNHSLPYSFNYHDITQKHLIEQQVHILDHCSAEALKQGALRTPSSLSKINKLFPRVGWSGLDAILGVICGYVSSHTEPYTRDCYIGIAGKHLIREIKKLPSYVPWRKYLGPGDILFNGEVGKTNNIVRWIECMDVDCFHKDGVIFGRNGLLMREIMTPELRAYTDSIAWYGIMGFVGRNVIYIPRRIYDRLYRRQNNEV